MMLRWDPFRELDRLAEQAFDTSVQGYGRVPRGIPIDAYRRGETFFVHFDMPGIDPASVEVTVEKNVLTVRGERNWTPQEGDEVAVAERPRGQFSRQLFLGETLDTGRLQATYENGVLTLTVPIAEAAKPRKVEVSVGNGHQGSIEASVA